MSYQNSQGDLGFSNRHPSHVLVFAEDETFPYKSLNLLNLPDSYEPSLNKYLFRKPLRETVRIFVYQGNPTESKKLKWTIIRELCMPLINEIQKKIADDQFEFSKHAVDQSIIRRVSVQEIREAITNGEVIEDYPDDKHGPSCLIFGRTAGGKPIHVQCSYPSRPLIKIITVYEPDPSRWFDFKQRKRP